MRQTKVKDLVLSAMFLTIGLLLPFLTGQIPTVGSRLLPMHIPVLLCGFLCGWPYGLAVGFVMPLLRSVLFGMPPMMPTAVAMAFELAAYGALAGLFISLLPRDKVSSVFPALIGAMVLGRAVWGVVAFLLNRALGNPFTLEIFLTKAFVDALPGIAAQIVIIPAITLAVWRGGKRL